MAYECKLGQFYIEKVKGIEKVYQVHTTFNVTYKLVDELNRLHGVSKAYSLVNYRIELNIGKLFSDSEVKNRIHEYFYKL